MRTTLQQLQPASKQVTRLDDDVDADADADAAILMTAACEDETVGNPYNRNRLPGPLSTKSPKAS